MDAEYILDTPPVRAFVAQVRAELAAAPPQAALEALRPAFAALLADQEWLPDTYRQPAPESGMGGGIATWLIYRAAGGELSLFSLVVPAGSATPVHDHLAWGLVGLYAGEQDERVYKRIQGSDGPVPLELAERNHLHPGDFYVLMPPEGDIHSVATLSEAPSVSIHLLGNDTGCVWRHAYTPEDGGIRAFRSGWSNVECHDPAL
jgi:predicted metal-dependent enzyme (double-stranded beta helix superfamily)